MYGFSKNLEKEETRLDRLIAGLLEDDITKPRGYLNVRHGKNVTSVSLGEYFTDEQGMRRRKSRLLGPIDSDDALLFARREFLAKMKQRATADLGLIKEMRSHYLPYSIEAVMNEISPASRLILANSGDYSFMIDLFRDGRLKPAGGVFSFPDRPTSVTPSGVRVRSKGEAIIGMLLEQHGVCYENERRLELIDRSGFKVFRYPDFTIYCRDKIIYWEHLGMIGNDDYLASNAEKLQLYHHNGLILWDNLIVTVDGPDGTIDAEAIDRIIEAFIVPYM